MSKTRKTNIADRNCVMCDSVFGPYTETQITCSPNCENNHKNKLMNESWATKQPKKKNKTNPLRWSSLGKHKSDQPNWEEKA